MIYIYENPSTIVNSENMYNVLSTGNDGESGNDNESSLDVRNRK